MNRSTAVSVGNISEAAAAAAAARRTKKSVSASLMLPVDEQEFHAISFGSVVLSMRRYMRDKN